MEKLHFTILNYALDYTLHPKLSDCTLCTLKYHIYHTLHPCVIFAVIFNKILLHVTNTCFLLRWNKVKRLKHHYLIPIKKKTQSFPHLPLSHVGPSSSLDSTQLHLHCFLKKKKKKTHENLRVSLLSSLAIDKVQIFYYRLAKFKCTNVILRNTEFKMHGCNS